MTGADSQCALTISTAFGRGRSCAHAASCPDQIGSSRSGGAPCPMYSAGIRVWVTSVMVVQRSTDRVPFLVRDVWSSVWQRPVDGGTAPLLDQAVDAGERSRAEEAAGGGERGRVGRLDPRDRAELGLERLGVATPEDRGERAAPARQRVDRARGDLLPAAAPMARG